MSVMRVMRVMSVMSVITAAAPPPRIRPFSFGVWLTLLRGVRTGTCMCSFEEKEFTNLSSTKEFLAHPHS